MVSVPAPNAVLSPDEDRIVAEGETPFAPYTTADLEGEADSDVYFAFQA